MRKSVSENLNFKRAMHLLETQIDSPEYLIRLWRLMGSAYGNVPSIEKVQPWYKGLEKYIT